MSQGWTLVDKKRPHHLRHRRQQGRHRRRRHRHHHCREGAGDDGDGSCESIEIFDGPDYLQECQRHMHSFRQAELDIPRMSVWVDDVRVRSLQGLMELVPCSQSYSVATLCTQTALAAPYETASQIVTGGGDTFRVVCECDVAESANIHIARSRRGFVRSVHIQKQMQILELSGDSNMCRVGSVELSVEAQFAGDCVGTVVAVEVRRHGAAQINS